MWRWWRSSQGYCTLCALAAIAAFLYMAFTVEPRLSYSPRDYQQSGHINSPDQHSNADSAKGQPRETFWQWTTKEAAGFYTLVLAVFAGISAVVAAAQAGLFIWQLRLMREGVVDARTAANAATTAAVAATQQAVELKRAADASERAFTRLERPYLYVLTPDWEQRDERLAPPWRPSVGYVVANFGKTPAIIENVFTFFGIKESYDGQSLVKADETYDLVVHPIYEAGERRKITFGLIREPHECGLIVRNVGRPDALVFDVPELQVAEGVFFRVLITYSGPFTSGHISSFCWRATRPFLHFVPYGRDEYNHVR